MAMQIRMDRVPGLFCEEYEPEAAPPARQAEALRQARRSALLHEKPARRAARIAQVVWRSLQPACLATLAPAFDLLWREKTLGVTGLPDPELALTKPDGLAGLAPDLAPASLLAAYARGLHPRCLAGPATYWAPARRLALHPANLRLDTRLRSDLHKRDFAVALDRDFDALVEACAAAGPDGGRLNPKLAKAHIDLFDAGLMHGIEVLDRSGKLAGGAYGVAFGRNFVLERWCGNTAAARLGLAVLAQHLSTWGFRLLDVSNVPGLAEGLNFVATERAAYNRALEKNMGSARPGIWRTDPSIYCARGPSSSARRLFDPPNVAAPDLAAATATQADLFEALGMAPVKAEATPTLQRDSLPTRAA